MYDFSDEKILTDLEARLKPMIGRSIVINLNDVDPDTAASSGGVLKRWVRSRVELELQEVLKDSRHDDLAIFGKSESHYWVIGTHSPHGYVTELYDKEGRMFYRNHVHFYPRSHSWGLACKRVSKNREELGLGPNAPDPPNPFLKGYLDSLTSPQSVTAPGLDIGQHSGDSEAPKKLALTKSIFYLPRRLLDYALGR